MLAQDGFKRRNLGRSYFGRPAGTVDAKSSEAEAMRQEAIKTAIELARKAGLNPEEIAKAMQTAGATVDEIKAYLNVHLETVTATATTTPTVPTVDPIKNVVEKASTSPWMIAAGVFIAWRLLK